MIFTLLPNLTYTNTNIIWVIFMQSYINIVLFSKLNVCQFTGIYILFCQTYCLPNIFIVRVQYIWKDDSHLQQPQFDEVMKLAFPLTKLPVQKFADQFLWVQLRTTISCVVLEASDLHWTLALGRAYHNLLYIRFKPRDLEAILLALARYICMYAL